MELLSSSFYILERIRYAFMERLRIAKVFFDPLSTYGVKNDIN